MAFLTRSTTTLLVLACLLGLAGIARAEISLRGARVVWVRGDRVYVASPNSVALEPGTILTFQDRGKKVATGEVTAVHDGELIVVRLTSGSLAKVKHLERLEIAGEPPVLRGPPLLRVGYPSSSRENLLFDCSHQALEPLLIHRAYKAEVTAEPGYCLVRDTTLVAAAMWPDTLLVRLFDNSADEEIALERGDLDVGVFWPGEPSTHIREVTRWRPPSKIGARGKLTATATARLPDQTSEPVPLSDDECRALERLNREFFRDDLVQASGLERPPALTTAGRFIVNASLPGREVMERFLNRVIGASVPIDTSRVIQLHYDQIWPDLPVLRGLSREYQLIVRCPVISAPKLRPYLESINTEALANLFQCVPAPQRP